MTVTNAGGGSDTKLRAFTYEGSGVTVSLPQATGDIDSTVEVPINVDSVSGLLAADITVSFDSSVLSAQGARTGTLTPGFSMACNTSTPGQISLSMASSASVDGSGVLAYIEFQVLGGEGATTALTLQSVSLNDGAVVPELSHGSFRVNDLYDISGQARYYQGAAAVGGVELTLSGGQWLTAATNAQGFYTFAGLVGGAYTVTPAKSDETNGISAYDASLVLQHSVGLITLTGHQATAADVNNSGQISSMDASYILQKAVDVIALPFPGAGVVWGFSPHSRSYTGLNSDQTGQDFTAVLLGDVSGNWSAEGGGLGSIRLRSGSATLELPDVATVPGAQVTVPMTLTLSVAEVYAVDLTVTHDESVVSAVRVDKGALAADWSMATNLSAPGVVRVALAGSTPITTDGVLLRLVYDTVGSPTDQTALTLTRADLNEGDIATTVGNGSVTVYQAVQAEFSANPTSGIAPLSVTFTNASTGDYSESLWDFGDGVTSTLESPTHIYASAGVYTVTLTASGPGGTDIETKAAYITVYDPVQADFSADPTSGIAPLSVTFTNASTGDYSESLWDFGDGVTSTLESPTHVYASARVYTVTLTASGLGGTDIETKAAYITAYQAVEAAFDASPTSGVVPLSVVFTNASTGDYSESLWDFGDGVTSTLESPTHIYTSAGVYTVTLNVSGLGGVDQITRSELITAYVCDVSGSARYWHGDVGVADVSLALVGEESFSAQSEASGLYTVTGVTGGNYTLTPSKSGEVRGISAYDASLVLRHSVDLITLTGHQSTAADVNQNGSINAMDASYILQKAVELITLPFPGAGVVWEFSPQSRGYTGLNSDQTGQDFTAVLLGDVSGNWSAGGLTSQRTGSYPADSVALEVIGGRVSPSGLVMTTLWVDTHETPMYSLDLTLAYAPSFAELLSVQPGALAEGFAVVANLDRPGEARVAMAGASPISGKGELLALTFRIAQPTAGDGKLLLTGAEVNEGDTPARVAHGSLAWWRHLLPMVLGGAGR